MFKGMHALENAHVMLSFLYHFKVVSRPAIIITIIVVVVVVVILASE